MCVHEVCACRVLRSLKMDSDEENDVISLNVPESSECHFWILDPSPGFSAEASTFAGITSYLAPRAISHHVLSVRVLYVCMLECVNVCYVCMHFRVCVGVCTSYRCVEDIKTGLNEDWANKMSNIVFYRDGMYFCMCVCVTA